jgi:TRAP transporter 4TM/12TM fusion protein|tara:strand:- start:12 stop:1922 length:1911 start_codon:yes stop_codon:yes gene_type:complete
MNKTNKRSPEPIWLNLKNLRKLLALLLSGFAIYTAAFGVQPDFIQTSVHLSLALILVFTLSVNESPTFIRSVYDWSLASLAFITIGYHFIFYNEVAGREGVLTDIELYLGIGAVILLLEGTRRIMGWPLVILALTFLLYTFIGPYLPGLFEHRGYDLDRVISQIYLGADGIFGTPLFVSSTFVVLIVILGSLLEISGASGVLMDIATALTGRARGGPAKAAVVGSSLMGMISGTAVANVLTTGTISIPLMKRTGYRPAVAGAIEAVASTGGQLMPPIMGAAAFIMADITETPYTTIALAAIIPSVLYYIAVFSAVHLEAVKMGMRPVIGDDLPKIMQTFKHGGHLLLSIVVFILMLAFGYSIMYSSLYAIISVVVLSYLRKWTRLTPARLLSGLINGAEAVLTVALATGTAGIIIAIISLTGLGLVFSTLIITASAGNLFLALALTMLSSLVLGMGLPTAAAYILVATLTAPALVELGVNLLAAHFFVFYSAMLSAITPPVALAAYAASGIANANPIRISIIAVKFGLAAFVVPYFFVLNPALLGQGDLAQVASAFLLAVLAAAAMAAATQGWFLLRLSIIERIILAIVVFLLFFPSLISNITGLAALIFVVIWQIIRWRSNNTNIKDSFEKVKEK